MESLNINKYNKEVVLRFTKYWEEK
jgi:hypothetical protein